MGGVQIGESVHGTLGASSNDSLIGFEELGQTDGFTTKALEFRLQQSG